MGKTTLNRKKINPFVPIFTGTKYAKNIKLQLFTYNSVEYTENKKFQEKGFEGFTDPELVYWLNIHGLHDIERIQSVCALTNLHNLALQDILDVNQRPKFQDYDENWVFSTKTVALNSQGEPEWEQVSFILGKNYLVSFQEKSGDHFDHIRQRIREKMGTLRDRGPDFLLFLLLEAIFDNYFKTLAEIEGRIEEISTIDINSDPSPAILTKSEHFKRQIYQIKKVLVPTKESITKIERKEKGLVQPENMKFFNELKDLCLSLIDDCDKMELRLDSNINLFFSVQGHRMNQVMKTLTIVATIFIPLTFIAGVYGMNFKNMPELELNWGYFGVWGLMLALLIVMVVYFRRKKWF